VAEVGVVKVGVQGLALCGLGLHRGCGRHTLRCCDAEW